MAQIVNFEFSVSGPEQAAQYSKVCGWSIQQLPDPVRYWRIETAGARAQGRIGGAEVVAHGRSPATERQLVPGYCMHAIRKDPQGICFALFEPRSASDW